MRFCYVEIGWTNDRTKMMIVGYSEVSVFNVQLPMGDNQTSLLNLYIHIRDQMDCVTEMNLSSVHVYPDNAALDGLLNDISQTTGGNTSNPIIHLLASKNQNLVGQILTSVSQQFNQRGTADVDKAASSK